MDKLSFSSDHVNYLILRYLQESGKGPWDATCLPGGPGRELDLGWPPVGSGDDQGAASCALVRGDDCQWVSGTVCLEACFCVE